MHPQVKTSVNKIYACIYTCVYKSHFVDVYTEKDHVNLDLRTGWDLPNMKNEDVEDVY